jgi:hypothetical protein
VIKPDAKKPGENTAKGKGKRKQTEGDREEEEGDSDLTEEVLEEAEVDSMEREVPKKKRKTGKGAKGKGKGKDTEIVGEDAGIDTNEDDTRVKDEDEVKVKEEEDVAPGEPPAKKRKTGRARKTSRNVKAKAKRVLDKAGDVGKTDGADDEPSGSTPAGSSTSATGEGKGIRKAAAEVTASAVIMKKKKVTKK